MRKFFNWLLESNRLLHFLGGFILGSISNGFYCASLVGCAVGAALEFKDGEYGGKWDWIDLTFTVMGAWFGALLKLGFVALWKTLTM